MLFLQHILICSTNFTDVFKRWMISLILIALSVFSIKKFKYSRVILYLQTLFQAIMKFNSIILVLVAIFRMPKFSAPASCNSFPKIFGGGGLDTYLYHIDVFTDYLAMVGNTYANTLATGLTNGNYYPYIAVASVAIPEKYYWAKVHSLKTDTSFYGVQFSTDGTLLITHSDSLSNFIVVYDVATGAVKSARSYSSGGYNNFNRLIKSMIISSGPSPMAYVLSDIRTSSSCDGQQLFKFDPTTTTAHSSAWIKQTTGSSTSNCGHLGLTFGRGEMLLYLFSYFNNLSTVSLLDINGNSKW